MRRQANPNKEPEKLKEKKEKKEQKEHDRKRAEKIKKLSWTYGLGTAGVIISAMCIYSLFTISRSSITTIALNDAEQLKEVFFGGEPWVVQCVNTNTTVSPAFVQAAKQLSVKTTSVRFGAIDCEGLLPSNRTMLERFGLPAANFSSAVIGYLFANAQKPLQVPPKYVLEPSKLALWIEKYSQPAVKELSWSDSFKKHCLTRDTCVMLFGKTKLKKPSWLSALMKKHRKTRFVSINRSNHKTSLDDKVKLGKGTDALAVAVLSKSSLDGVDKYTLFTYRGEWSESGVSGMVNEALVGKMDPAIGDKVELGGEPWFDAPPKASRDKNKAQEEQGMEERMKASERAWQAADRNKEWREERRAQRARDRPARQADEPEQKERRGNEWEDDSDRRQEGPGKGGGGSMDAEKRRLQAARLAEEQLSEDDDVVVSDIDEDDDHLI